MKRVAALLLVPAGLLVWFVLNRPLKHGPGITAPEPPAQVNIQPPQPFPFEEHVLYRLARFEATARVLSTESYYLDRESRLAPVDLALGWGPMSDERVLEHLSISQGGRWYQWRYTDLPIPRHDVIRNSANMHMIPADGRIKRQLKRVRAGEIVHIEGYLVEAVAEDGWRWRSSLTREDAGNHACELVYVQSIDIIDPVLPFGVR